MIEFNRVLPVKIKNKVYKVLHYSKPARTEYKETGEVEIILKFPALKQKEYYIRENIVYISCPHCGKVTCLKDHEISERGIVTPSVVSNTKNCNFHNNVKLRKYDLGV